jgi:transposase
VRPLDLTDEQWLALQPLIPKKMPREDGKARPRAGSRPAWNGILWVLRTGAPRQDLPERYPSPATCHCRFQAWRKDGVLERILRTLARDLKEQGQLDLTECFIDGFFVVAKKGGRSVGTPALAGGARETKRGKGTKVKVVRSRRTMAVADGHGLPFAVHIESASPNEFTLLEATLASRFILAKPQRLIGNKAYDSLPWGSPGRPTG